MYLKEIRHNPGLGMLSHVMKAWTATVTLGRYAEAELLGQLGEGVSRCPSCKPLAALGDEESRGGSCSKNVISGFSVRFQSVHRRGVNRYVPRLSKFRASYVKDSEIEVDIFSIQTDSLAHPHTGYRQQAEQGCERPSAEPL